MDDKSLQARVDAEIERVGAGAPVAATVHAGVVVLKGVVANEMRRVAIEQALLSLPEVMDVHNHLHVALPQGDVRTQLRALLEREDIDASGLTIEEVNGDVTLTGRAESWFDSNAVERLAWTLPDVRSVTVQIELPPDASETASAEAGPGPSRAATGVKTIPASGSRPAVDQDVPAMAKDLPVFATTLQVSNTWLRDVQSRLQPCDRQQAYNGLRSVFHVLRDRLPMEAVTGLSAQLPMLLRGLFLEGWRPGQRPTDLDDVQAFAAAVGERLAPDYPRQPNEVAEAVFAVLAQHLDPGETAKLAGFLPARLRRLFPAAYV